MKLIKMNWCEKLIKCAPHPPLSTALVFRLLNKTVQINLNLVWFDENEFQKKYNIHYQVERKKLKIVTLLVQFADSFSNYQKKNLKSSKANQLSDLTR